MLITKILKITLLIIFSYLISTFIKTKLDLNYDSVTLNVNIDFFEEDVLAISHGKLHALPEYSIISNYFVPKKILVRINNKIARSNLCVRDEISKKRNAKLKAEDSSIIISMIFLNNENAEKCLMNIKNYISSQKELFLDETQTVINKVKSEQRLFSLDLGTIDENIENMVNSFNLEDVSDDSLSHYFKIFQLKKIIASPQYDPKDIYEYYARVAESDIFKFRSKISDYSGGSFKSLEFEYLFILVLILLTLIVYRRKVERYFIKIKKKL